MDVKFLHKIDRGGKLSLTQREFKLRAEKNEIDFFSFIVEQEKERASLHPDAPRGKTMDEQFESNLQRAAQLCPMLASIRIMRPNQTLNDVERAQIACIFVRHSMERKDMLRLDWNSSLARSLYQLRHRGLYSYTIQGSLLALALVTFWEIPCSRLEQTGGEHWAIALGTEAVCMIVFVVDLGMKWKMMGYRAFVETSGSVTSIPERRAAVVPFREASGCRAVATNAPGYCRASSAARTGRGAAKGRLPPLRTLAVRISNLSVP